MSTTEEINGMRVRVRDDLPNLVKPLYAGKLGTITGGNWSGVLWVRLDGTDEIAGFFPSELEEAK